MNKLTYEQLYSLFAKGYNINDTCFYFSDDPQEIEHFIGYMPEINAQYPYWAGLCDVENGCSFSTAKELLEAPIYNGKSIKDRYDQLQFVSISGLSLEDWLLYFSDKLS